MVTLYSLIHPQRHPQPVTVSDKLKMLAYITEKNSS